MEKGVLTPQTMRGLKGEEKEVPTFNVARPAPSTQLTRSTKPCSPWVSATPQGMAAAFFTSSRIVPEGPLSGWHCQGNSHIVDSTVFLELALPWMTTSRSGSMMASALL